MRAFRGDAEVSLGSPQQRAVLAMLLVHAGAQVTPEDLVDGVWGEKAPETASHVIRVYIHRLRQALGREGPGRIDSVGGGYALDLDAHSCDLTRFTRLLDHARQARSVGDPAGAADLYTEALRLWTGPALAGVPGPYASAQGHRLNELRLSAQEEHLTTVVDLGHYDHAATELSTLTQAHPLRERLRELHMLALYGAGRQAEALTAFNNTRLLLREELGVDPGPGLRTMHERILAMDPALLDPAPRSAAPPAATAAAGPVAPIPAQLPADVPHFTGRTRHLETLTALAGQAETTVVVSAIGGTAGIGKTALAIHWAHQHAAQFPDGALYVNLRGFDPAASPLPPDTALRGFLDALGTPATRIPTGPEAQQGLYRSLLTGKRMLIVLDNARDTDQVKPLLPGTPGCLVLITSRNQLTTLIALNGAHTLTLDLLTPEEAHHLLTHRLGTPRIEAEPDATQELIELCARLPLALNITAARAALQPKRPLAAFVDELRDAHRQLDALSIGEATANVRAVFSWSYRTLAPAAARVFRLLGVHPAPDISLRAAAGLSGFDPDTTRHALDELARAHLIIEHSPGRYTLHDLLRAYAAEQAAAHEDDAERQAALRRVVDFYAHTAYAAELVLAPLRDSIPLDPPIPGMHPQLMPDASAALAWFDAENPNLLAAQQAAVGNAWHRIVWQLAWSLSTVQIRRGHRHDQVAVWQAALDAATHLPEPGARILAHRRLGIALADLGRHKEAIGHGRQALDLAEEHHGLGEQAAAHHMLAWIWEQRGDRQALEHALEHAEHTLDLRRALGEPAREAQALNETGWFLAQLGDFDTARTHCEAALAIQRRIRDPAGEADTLDSLGYIADHSGHHQQAIDYYQLALAVYAELGHLFQTADTLDNLGHAYAALAENEQAETVWRKALELYRQQGRDQAADRVRIQLDARGRLAGRKPPSTELPREG
jgi:DNA-binding SARP family transcriptional activator/tetratricopeptide (TPR) repeat protein